MPVSLGEISADAQSLFPEGVEHALNQIRMLAHMVRTVGSRHLIVRIPGVPQAEAVVVLGGEDEVLEAAVLGCLRPFLRLEADGIEGFLAARPCAAHQAQDVLLSLRLQAFIEAFRISHRIHVAALQRRSRIVSVIVKIIRAVFRLRLIQPEAADTLLIIIFLTFLPHKFLCARMGRIVEDCISHPRHVVLIAAVRIDQIAHLTHGTEILAALIDGRPDRDNRLDSHLFQLFYHCFRIRPVSRLKLEVALSGPVEEIDDDGIHRQASSLVLSRHRQKLVLRRDQTESVSRLSRNLRTEKYCRRHP